MNKTNETVTFNLDSFVATSTEIGAIDLLDTTVGGANNTSEDARALGTTTYWFDGDLSTKAKYCATPTKGGYVTYDLGQEITLQSLKVYVLDTAIDYPRDAIIQCSMDNVNWTDLITIGDGVENSSSDASVAPVESDGGWKHDTIDVAYAYVENANIDNVKARYIRMYFTAAYNSRWVEINEILINGGAYISTINDPTFVTDAALQKGYEPQNLNDSDLTTAFKPDGTENGTLVYNLSDESDVNRINILQSGNSISNAVVSVRTGEDTWVELGTLDRSYNVFCTANLEHVYAVKIAWSDVVPTIYEIITQKAAGDVLEKNLTDAQKDLETANAAAAEAASALSTLDSKVAAAEAKVAAATGTDKVKAEVELQNLYAEQAAAAAEAATKNAAVATAEAAVAKVEANNARYQAEASTDEAEKSTLEAKAAEKDQAAQTKLAEAEAQKAIATQKLAEQKSYEEAATKKQAELDQLLKEASNKTEETNKTPVTTPTTPGKTEATTFTYKNISYKVVSAGKTVTVTGVTTKKLKSATIPSTVKNDGITYKVVSIQAKAFKGCKKLTKVTIGSNVKKIGKEAFAQCTSLKNVNMKKASNITSIGKKAFSKIKSSAKITVPKKKLAKYKKMLKKAGLPKTAVVK
jgi:hyaluronoglucosaminidase/hexosaminidase